MAQYQYQIHHVEHRPDSDFYAQLEKVLEEYGMDGWELVQVMPEADPLLRVATGDLGMTNRLG